MKGNLLGSFLFRYFIISVLLFSSVGFVGYKLSRSFLEVLRPVRKANIARERLNKPGESKNLSHVEKRKNKRYKVLGMSRPNFVASTFAFSLFLLFVAHHLLTMYLFQRAAKQTREVLSELKSGNLKARFPKDGIDNLGIISSEVNDMATELEKLVLNLERAEIQRKGILQELVHDLRTPITSLRGSLEAMKEHGNSMTEDETKSFLSTSLSEVHYFEKLVNDLLFISDIGDSWSKLSLEQSNLVEIIKNEISTFQSTNIKIVFEFDSLKNSSLMADKQQLKRLLHNALDNATSFARKCVDIKLDNDEKYFYISISDDGVGISKERQANFGEKFNSREVDSLHEGRISIGLGAVIMKKITTAHGGDLAIYNKIEGNIVIGAKLVITLPKA